MSNNTYQDRILQNQRDSRTKKVSRLLTCHSVSLSFLHSVHQSVLCGLLRGDDGPLFSGHLDPHVHLGSVRA